MLIWKTMILLIIQLVSLYYQIFILQRRETICFNKKTVYFSQYLITQAWLCASILFSRHKINHKEKRLPAIKETTFY